MPDDGDGSLIDFITILPMTLQDVIIYTGSQVATVPVTTFIICLFKYPFALTVENNHLG